MSDRIAVFNEGRIEQVGTPGGGLRAARQHDFVAGFVGVSNVLERDGKRFTVRPEKIQILEPASEPKGLHTEKGTIRRRRLRGDDHPLSSSTSMRGENFKSSARTWRPPLRRRRSSADVKVTVGWRPDHTVAVEGEREETQVRRIHDSPREGGRCSSPAGLVMLTMFAIGCGSDDDDSGSTGGALTEVGSRRGPAQPGRTGPATSPTRGSPTSRSSPAARSASGRPAPPTRWSTRCATGQFDGVSASGNASLRLVAGDDVAPVNLDLIPNYETIFDDLKDQPYNTVDGVNYGVPHGRGANLLMWNTDSVKPDPTSWGVILDPAQASKYKGKISAYDDSVYIADAAVYLKAHQPDLGIDNPYELDDEQFNAAVDLLKQQKPNVGEYWVRCCQADPVVRERGRRGRHHLAVPVLRAAGREAPGGSEPGRARASCPRRARPDGPTPG